jgi:hypothetical protein
MVSNTQLVLISVIIVLAIIYLKSKSEHLLKNCRTDCPKCKNSNQVRPNVTTRVGCNSTKCKCMTPVVYESSEYVKLDCTTCAQCNTNMKRPNKKINTTKNLGCNDKRCKCEYDYDD